jgi:hypothetical protein
MPAHTIEKIPGEKYPFPLRDVPGEVMIEVEKAAEEAGKSANAQALAILRTWAKRRRKPSQ